MKNQKGSKAKKQIAQIQNQIKNQGKSARQIAEEKKREADKLAAKKGKTEDITVNQLFKPVLQKVDKGKFFINISGKSINTT